MDHRRRAADDDEPADAPRFATGPAAPRPRTICLCVDDFGLHAGVNDAALRLAGLGRVHAIACMVGAPAWPAGAALLRRLPPGGIDVGLHLDFTEHPVEPRSRRDLPALIAASALRRLDPRALRREVAAQLDAFEQALGRPPAFVDGHQHVHQLPVLRQALLDELAARGRGGWRPWLRSTRAAGTGAGVKARLIGALGSRGLEKLARRRGHPLNRRLLGVYDFRGGPARYSRLLAGWLEEAADGDLLMCHPASSAAPNDPIAAARVAECSVMTDDAFAGLVERQGLRLAPMSRIVGRSPAQEPGAPPQA